MVAISPIEIQKTGPLPSRKKEARTATTSEYAATNANRVARVMRIHRTRPRRAPYSPPLRCPPEPWRMRLVAIGVSEDGRSFVLALSPLIVKQLSGVSSISRETYRMKRLRLDHRLLVSLAAALVICAVPAIAIASSADVPWQTGIRAVGNGATIEPAVNDVTGAQTFLITPNHSPFWSVNQHPPGTPIPANLLNTSAPLYLVTYPIGSTVDTTDKLNCYTEGAFDPTGTLPYNCDHAQIPGIKGHDHLVGVVACDRNVLHAEGRQRPCDEHQDPHPATTDGCAGGWRRNRFRRHRHLLQLLRRLESRLHERDCAELPTLPLVARTTSEPMVPRQRDHRLCKRTTPAVARTNCQCGLSSVQFRVRAKGHHGSCDSPRPPNLGRSSSSRTGENANRRSGSIANPTGSRQPWACSSSGVRTVAQASARGLIRV